VVDDAVAAHLAVRVRLIRATGVVTGVPCSSESGSAVFGDMPEQDVHVPHIDLPADLNMVDDDDLNVARVPAQGVPRDRFVVAGTQAAWTWALI
jgi:hypothetical protein